MPFKDKKGPLGEGPLTGRGQGPCEGDRTETQNVKLGRGGVGRGRRGSGRGMGFKKGRMWGCRGNRSGFGDKSREENLIDYREALEKELESVKKEEESLK